MKVTLKNVRLSFPSLFETEKYAGADTEKYCATFLIHKDDPQVKLIKEAIKSVAEEEFGKPIPKTIVFPLKDGDEKEYDGYAGHYTIKGTTKRRPVTVDKSKTPVTAEDGVFYAGCYVNVSMNIYAMNNQYGKKILCGLNGVQFAKDGDSFGNGSNNALDDFDVIESASDDFDPFA